MAKKKDFGAMERGRPAGTGAERARDALRTRLATPPSKLPLDQLQPNPLNPRDPEQDTGLEDLAATMRQHGQLQQAQVIARDDFLEAFPDTADQLSAAPWVVFIGNRRLAAARLAGLEMLDVRAPEGVATPEEIESRVLIENLQRSDLPLLKEAEFLQRQLDRDGQSLRSVGAAIGKSFTYVQQRVGLLKLIPELQEQLRQGNVTFKTARALYALSPEEQATVYRSGPPWSAAVLETQAEPLPAAATSPDEAPSGAAGQAVADSDRDHAVSHSGPEATAPTGAASNSSKPEQDSQEQSSSGTSTATQPLAGNELVAPLVHSVNTVLEEIRRSEAAAEVDTQAAAVLQEAARQVESALMTLRRM
ncbi:chromosome partitioning protein, ParB family [Pseudonocardia ammonioxydans]|uniref:Chromosome partitioning protein, ParB family n=1 Tax=Pseudonocardia ammonioxydans TaxID=260086 RepID=A0A1I5IRT2_PSUAM|nr:ParB/RepB/Spo0J family partition protein [Pseudonocardia ammonioxydans]SFO63212.1 chromosome partitioning protein, ParB family [Pseudonocardia ammonioxydans]